MCVEFVLFRSSWALADWIYEGWALAAFAGRAKRRRRGAEKFNENKQISKPIKQYQRHNHTKIISHSE